MIIKKLAITACALALSGCTSVKPPVPFQLYHELSFRDAMAEQCLSLGFMDIQTAATAKNFNLQDLNHWSYDSTLYQKATAESARLIHDKPPQKTDCDRFSMVVVQRQLDVQQNYQQQQLELLQRQAQNQTMKALRDTLPKKTHCNKIDGKIICSTYQ